MYTYLYNFTSKWCRDTHHRNSFFTHRYMYICIHIHIHIYIYIYVYIDLYKNLRNVTRGAHVLEGGS